jgi:hypothetical protein
MATSSWTHIQVVIELVFHLKPKRILDIGKGFGKYGLLLHEYVGVPGNRRPNPNLTIGEQSSIVIDAVECNGDYLWPHIPHFYRNVFHSRVEDTYTHLPAYDLVLLIEVLEHIPADTGKQLLSHFYGTGASIIVTTPREFYERTAYESDAERHVSFWPPKEIAALQLPFDYTAVGSSWVYLISNKSVARPRSFGHSWQRRLIRTAKAVRDEWLPYQASRRKAEPAAR